MRNRRNKRLSVTLILAAASLAALPGSLGAQGDGSADYGYGYYRTIEGEALITGMDADAEPLEAEANYPVLTGDRLWVGERSRLEAILPDRSILRVGEKSELFFESIAGSSDAPEDASTAIGLLEGELQLDARRLARASEPALIETPNARIYFDLPGVYRLFTDGRGWTEVVVREGFAEINTDRGSTVARDGESVEISGSSRPDVDVARAGAVDDLERWGEELSGTRLADAGYVDQSLAYAAEPLSRSGHWLSVSGGWAWRPSVRVGWRPFTDGWWVYTPSGLSWVAYEPWGWVTSHYGAWDYVPGHGWLWFPGSVYSPAWVYWYWGPSHTAWIPSGYYTRYYGPRYGFDFRFGVYGWAGGYWDSWSRWTFCPTRYFGHRRYRSYWRSGHEMQRDRRLHAVPRGVITTDTRDLHPRRWGKPTEIVDVLGRRHGSGGAGSTRSLGDVTPFVERRSSLPEETRRMVRSHAPSRDGASRTGAKSRLSDSSRGGTSAAPWHVQRPDRTRTEILRSAGPLDSHGTRSGQATDWDLIERLRRFENKQEALPRSPRSVTGHEGEREVRPITPRTETPTRRILDGVRSRAPQGLRQPQAPTSSRQRPSAAPRSSRPQSSRPQGTRPQPQRRPPTTSSPPSRGSGGSSVRSTVSGSSSRRSGSSVGSSGSSSKQQPSTRSRSKARPRKN